MILTKSKESFQNTKATMILKKKEKYDIDKEKFLIDFSTPPSSASLETS